MKKRTSIISLILSAAMIFSLTACGSGTSSSATTETTAAQTEAQTEAQAAEETTAAEAAADAAKPEDYDWPKFITFLGASSGGNAILSVSALAQVVTEYLPTTVSAQVTPGASQNMYLMEQGDGNYAWGGDFNMYSAKKGILSFKDQPVNIDMNLVMLYNESIWQIAVRKGSGITCLEDLRGKKVVVGAAGGGTESGIRNMMSALGYYTDEKGYDFQAEYSGVSEGCELISNNQADAIIIAGSIPFSSYLELFVSDKIELIGLTQEEVDTLTSQELGLAAAKIPAGSYDGKISNDLLTVSAWSGLICKADCSEEEVYWITRTICEHWDELGGYHDMFTKLTAEEAAKASVTKYADIHPGALRYYKEMGWM